MLRGLFRLWVVLSGIWITATAVYHLDASHAEQRRNPWTLRTDFIIDCVKARKLPYPPPEGDEPYPLGYEVTADFNRTGRDVCNYEPRIFRQLFPELQHLSAAEVNRLTLVELGLLSEENSPPLSSRLFNMVGPALIPPFLIFVLGASVFWVWRGFRRPPAS